MKILRRKSDVVLPAIEQDEKHSDKGESIRGISKNLTTLDFIGLVALTVLLPVWSVAHLIDGDNRHDDVDKIKKE